MKKCELIQADVQLSEKEADGNNILVTTLFVREVKRKISRFSFEYICNSINQTTFLSY